MTDSPATPLVLKSLATLLKETALVVESMTEETYRGDDPAIPSVGPHLRHSLDHVTALLAGTPEGVVDYDRRERGGIIETDPQAGIDALLRTAEILLAQCDTVDGSLPLEVRMMVDGQGVEFPFSSTFGRELMFVYSHAIHHNALVAQVCRLRGIGVPDGFGYAPSTLAHLAAGSR